MEDPFDVLGLKPGTDGRDIRAAYLKLARQFHPDRFTMASPEVRRSAHELMQQVNHAFAVLTNPRERARYERQRRLAEKRRSTGSRSDGANGGVNSTTAEAGSSSTSDSDAPGRHQWRAEPQPEDLEIREFSGWGGAHWVYVHAPGGRAGKMNVTTGEVTIEREELRDEVLLVLQHYTFNSWA